MKTLGVVLLWGVSIVLAGCGFATPPAAPMQELSLTATDIAYDVNYLEVTAGQPVKLTLYNEGTLEHDIIIMDLPYTGEVIREEAAEETADHDMHDMSADAEIHLAAPSGGSATMQFTPSTPGQYKFVCSVEGHQEAGMEGSFVVK